MLIVLKIILWSFRFFVGAVIFRCAYVLMDYLSRDEKMLEEDSHIRKRIFLVEFIGGVTFIICGFQYGYGKFGVLSLHASVIFVYLGILLVIAMIDWNRQMIYDRFHILILILAIANIWIAPEHGFADRLIGSVIVSLPMLVLAVIVPGAFGGGDIKLMAVSGAFLGAGPVICAMFLGLLSGGGYGAFMLKCKKLGRKDSFAFGPFLAFGLTVAALYGDQIISRCL